MRRNNCGRRNALLWRWPVLLLFCGLLWPGALHASKSSEDKALATASALFEDHLYDMAETNLINFLAAYTNSPHRADAVLYLARCRFEQSNYDGAIRVLTADAPQAGRLAGEYAFWTASARLANGDNARAADEFAGFIKNFPNSPRQLEAVFDLADARSKMEHWPEVMDLLQRPDGLFRQLAAADPKNSFVTRGLLLLGDALFAQGKYADGEAVVRGIDSSALAPEWQWRRQYLLCRLELAGGRATAALQDSTNLLDTASGPRHQAASRFLRGDILESLGRASDALDAYTNNFDSSLAPEDQRQALLKAVTLVLGQNQIPAAVQLLENYVAQRTNGAALDLARVSLAELDLKLHYNPELGSNTADLPLSEANPLPAALTNLDIVISNFSRSPLLPQAHLDRGWCYWALTNMPAARTDFQAAADTLPFSPDGAVARFKLADTQLYLHDYDTAITNYNLLLQQYANVESVTNGLFDQALYQILQAALARGDINAAQTALRKILEWYPNSLFGDRGQLLMGESGRYDYAMARRVFNELLVRSPQTPLLPEVEYAIARTYEQEGNWLEAIRSLDHWVTRHATNAPRLLPLVEYSRALDFGKAGQETNALVLFTNFVARYSSTSNILAAWAQNWVADYYFNLGDNESAEKNYQLLFQKFPNAGDLPYQARLMAGRAALARQGIDDARQYFLDLVNNSNAPAGLVEQGYFALGDTSFQLWQGNPTNGAYLVDATDAMTKLTNGAPTNALAVQALGRLGDYYMQWADRQWETNHKASVYSNAMQLYQVITNFPPDDVDMATRSEAEVALGRIAEQKAQTDQALAHYCKVLYDTDPDHSDPYWVEQAGIAAAGIYGRQEQWDRAIRVYRRVERAVPALRASLEKAILDAQTAANKARN